MLKKSMIVLLLVFFLFGCTKTDPSEPVDTPEVTKEPIVYESLYTLDILEEVSHFQTISLSSLRQLRDFEFKTPIFDLYKTKDLTLGQVNINTSDSILNRSWSEALETYHVYRYFKYIDTKQYVTEFAAKDFTSYLTETFLNDISKLQAGEVSPDFIFEKYGTHVIMSVDQGYEIEIELLIQSRDLDAVGYQYLETVLMQTRPITFPIVDQNFQLYESLSRIEMRLSTTPNPDSFDQILNDFHQLELPIVNIIYERGLIPIYQVFGYYNEVYLHAVSLLKTRHQELFPS